MNTLVTTITPDLPLLEAARIMLDNKYGCLPVVEKGRLVGILTEADFTRLVVEILSRNAEEK
jgi:CBS domain-containing membrane protein